MHRFSSYILHHPAVMRSPAHVRKQLHHELTTSILAHLDHEEDNARLVAQKQGAQLESTQSSSEPCSSHEITIPFTAARVPYYAWVRSIAADNTQEPAIFTFFTCLVAPTPGAAFFRGARQHYVAGALSRHLANLCRQYNDWGSVGRDRAENNVNSVNFVEFHEPPGGDLGKDARDEKALKADLFAVAEFERECLNHAVSKLGAQVRAGPRGKLKMDALGVFIDTVDLYGQIYVARDITNRVR